MISTLKLGILEIVCLFTLALTAPLAAHALEEPRVHIALGDSVAAGFGVAYTERYTALFSGMLKEAGYINRYVNFAEDGFTTAMLLDLINNMDEYERALFQDAYVITINIGGNDILTPLLGYLPTQEDVMDIIFELWEFIEDTMLIIPEIMGIASDFQEVMDSFSLWRVWSLPGINRMVQDAAPVLDDVTDLFDRVGDLNLIQLLPLLEGNFSPELDAALYRGVDEFAAQFNQIIDWVNTHAPGAVIIVNTVYNPIPEQVLGMSLAGLWERAGELIQSINRTIVETSHIKGYLVADVYTGFADEPENIMNFFVDTSALMLSFDVIHPSAAGHELIAGVNYGLFRGLGE